MLVLGGASGCEPALGPGVVEVREAQRIDVARPVSDPRPPSDSAFARAPLVDLPDRWPADRRARARQAWYRAVLTLPESAHEREAVYLPHLMMNAAVWVNGERVGSGGRMLPAPTRNWNHPLLFALPGGALRPGRNVLDVQLAVQPTYPGLLAPLYVGSEDALRSAYEWRLFWQVSAVQISILLTAYWGLAGFALWGLRRGLYGFGWTAAGCLLWAFAMLDLIVRDPPISALAWQWFPTSSLAASVSCFALGARGFLSMRGGRLNRVIVTIWTAGALAFALALGNGSPLLVEGVVVTWALATLGVTFHLTRLFFLIRRRSLPSEGQALRYLAPMAVIALAFLMHDLAVASGILVPPSVLLVPYIGAIIGLWGGARIVELLATALAESEALNRDLERRVDERGAEIARNYEQIRDLERSRLLHSERERMMRDIHDGMGGQLTSMLSLVESDRVSPDEVADALRDALDDMRLLIASLGPTADDLLTLLATWRARIERRLERRGLVFDWQVADLPPLPWLGPREALNVLRIFQEGVTNIVKHARATTITVRTVMRPSADGEPGVTIEISDDGQGFAAESAGAMAPSAAPIMTSQGLGNMARRAAELGGTIEVRSGPPGTRIELWLPLAAPARSPGALPVSE